MTQWEAPGCSVTQLSTAWHSTAQHSRAQHGTAWHSMAQHGTERHTDKQHDTACHFVTQRGTARQAMTQHDAAWQSMAQHARTCLPPWCKGATVGPAWSQTGTWQRSLMLHVCSHHWLPAQQKQKCQKRKEKTTPLGINNKSVSTTAVPSVHSSVFVCLGSPVWYLTPQWIDAQRCKLFRLVSFWYLYAGNHWGVLCTVDQSR